jgi:uncharacterized protein YdeI (YjbR/CyaY-like superfamily)
MAIFFETADRFAAWLQKHGGTKPELVVGYYKLGSQRPSMTWAESVDEALCFGWIDGVRERYRQLVIRRIVSAKRPETRERRLQDLIQASKEKRRL